MIVSLRHQDYGPFFQRNDNQIVRLQMIDTKGQYIINYNTYSRINV